MLVIETLVAYTALQMGLKNIDLIIRNFPLSERSKTILTQTLENNMDMVTFIDNSLKNEYKNLIKNIPEIPSERLSGFFFTTTLYDKSDIDKFLREVTFNTIQTKGLTPKMVLKYKEFPFFKKILSEI